MNESVDFDPTAAAVDAAPAGMVQVGENYVRPSTGGKSEHIDLPIGQAATGRSEAYDAMVTRDGFPLVESVDIDPTATEEEVDVAI